MSVLASLTATACFAMACTLLTDLDGLSDGVTAVGDAAGPDVRSDVSISSLDGSPDAHLDGGGDATRSPYVTAVLADSPLLYYRLGEPEGTPARDEVSGATQPYPVQGVTLGTAGALAGEKDTAITLDGTGKIDLTQDTDFEGKLPFSVEAWVSRALTGGDGLGFLVDHEAWSNGRRGWDLRASPTGFSFERSMTVDGGTSYNSASTDEAAVAGEWRHVVGTFDGTTMRLYVDAVRRDTYTASISLSKLGVPFAVGKQNCTPCTSTGFYGALDELAIYPRALSEARIVVHYNAGKGL